MYEAAVRITELGDAFYDVVRPAVFPEPLLRFRNSRAARAIGLDGLSDAAWKSHFASFEPLPNNLLRPLALRYHGHQFGSYNPDLGDGRGFLFAQVRDQHHRILDLGTKGSGTTPWSRGGDGRLTLKGGVREVLATEMLEALGVKTSKTLSLFETGEKLMRGDEPSPTRSSVLVRLSHSHLRFGTFQRFAHEANQGKPDGVSRLRDLVEYALRTHFPEVTAADDTRRAAALFDAAVTASAKLTAEWMTAGFCHGVLNTDNMTVTGESFDYGPYRFVPTFDPNFVAAYFDHAGLYAFGRQPAVVTWNLHRFADALRPLAPDAPLAARAATFDDQFDHALTARTLARLGVSAKGSVEDAVLTRACWAFLETSHIPFEQLFFDVYGGSARRERALAGPAAHHYVGPDWIEFSRRLATYLPASPERVAHPYFQADSPCTLLIDEIEAVWARIAAADDWRPFVEKISEIRSMGEALGLPRRVR
jgi:uncharacterized protein YdiU (UPF0061 family)